LAWPVDEGAHRIGIGRTSVYKLAAEGRLRLIKVAGRTLIPDSEIVRIAAEGA
jgi:excisionase family DNA binding protein